MSQLHRSPTSTPTRSEEKRRNLLVTASELFLQQGYDGLSMDAIVAAAGSVELTTSYPVVARIASASMFEPWKANTTGASAGRSSGTTAMNSRGMPSTSESQKTPS